MQASVPFALTPFCKKMQPPFCKKTCKTSTNQGKLSWPGLGKTSEDNLIPVCLEVSTIVFSGTSLLPGKQV